MRINAWTVRYYILRPFRLTLRLLIACLAAVPHTTFGERAEMAGRGPCQRCVGHAVIAGPEAGAP